MRDAKPSSTAFKVAINLLVLGAKPGTEHVLPPGLIEATARLLVACGLLKERTVGRLRSPWMVRIYEAFDWMMPGQFVAFAHRKAFCERQVREGMANGVSQILVLGAGYDTLAWRLSAQFPKSRFFEIDHPATASVKARGVDQLGARANHHLLPKDLSAERLVDVLEGCEEWDPRAPSIFIAEGLVEYLPPAAVHDLFAQCAAIAGPSRLAFTYAPTGPNGKPEAGPLGRLLLWLLKVRGEPWLWSARPDELPAFLSKAGWILDPQAEDPTVQHGVERFVVARSIS